MKTEYTTDWTNIPVPQGTKFPLVNMEQRKRIAIKLGSSLSFKHDKAYARDDIEADALALLWDDNRIIELQTAKYQRMPIPAEESEQIRFLYNCVRRIIERTLKLDGPYGGVSLNGFKNRYEVYNQEEGGPGFSSAAEEKMSRFIDFNKKYMRG